MVHHLRRPSLKSHPPVGPLHLSRENQFGNDCLEWDPALEHDLHKRFADAPKDRGQRLLDRQVKDRFLFRRELDSALAETTDGFGNGENARSGCARYVRGGLRRP